MGDTNVGIVRLLCGSWETIFCIIYLVAEYLTMALAPSVLSNPIPRVGRVNISFIFCATSINYVWIQITTYNHYVYTERYCLNFANRPIDSPPKNFPDSLSRRYIVFHIPLGEFKEYFVSAVDVCGGRWFNTLERNFTSASDFVTLVT
jgi:hypothetical protein